jgi:hypothetical protein
MSWGLAFAIFLAALIAFVHAMRLCLIRLYRLEQHVLDGRGLSPSLLLAHPLTRERS